MMAAYGGYNTGMGSGGYGGGGLGMGGTQTAYSRFNPTTMYGGSGFSTPQTTTLGQYQKQLDTAPQDYSNILGQLGSQVGKSVYQDPNFSGAISNLQNLSTTGGYSANDINAIRERATSPIRSIYANAQADINRQRNLQGGYSPNYTAATAKMARDLSSQLSDATTNVNAQLAQNIVGNKMQASGQLASDTGSAASGDLARAIQALGSMSSLYGTSPGLLNTLGSQTLQGQQLTDQENEFNTQMMNQNNMAILSNLIRGM